MKSVLARLAIAAALLVPASGAFAKSIEDVKKEGFKCERAGVDSIVCSKNGQKDYVCDNGGTCAQLLVMDPGNGGGVKPPRDKLIPVPGAGALMQ
jgi:hypothetical protein